MANNLTLKIMANLANKYGLSVNDKCPPVEAAVSHLDERGEALLRQAIGDARPKPIQQQTNLGRAAKSGAISLDELAHRRHYGGRERK